jgi:hypothetical protein
MLLLLLLSQGGSPLDIVSPRESEAVVAVTPQSDGRGVRVRIDLGADVRVPVHGFLAVHLDGARVLLACPGTVESAADCPSAGETLSGEVSLDLGDIRSGEHLLTAQLLDTAMAPLVVARRVFFVTYAAESDDDVLREGAPAFNMIVFSKDRACQLDQLLSSLRTHVRNVDTPFIRLQVLYTHSTAKFADGYKAVKRLHPSVIFHQQGNLSQSVTSSAFEAFVGGGGAADSFKGDYLRLLDDSIPYTMHFMDDMLATDTWGLAEQLATHRLLASRPEVVAMSLRLHPGITKCYATNEDTPPPNFDPEMTWVWREARGDWGYPMSLDAHVFRTHETLRLALHLDYHNPNTLEGSLAMHCFSEPSACAARLACFNRGKVLNIPANRVQDTFPNRFMADGPSPELLNTEFLFHRRLTSEHHWFRAFDSVHVPHPLVFAVGALQHETAELLHDLTPRQDL